MKVLFPLLLFVVYLQELEGRCLWKKKTGWWENCFTCCLGHGVQTKEQWWIGSCQHENSKLSSSLKYLDKFYNRRYLQTCVALSGGNR
jgi:hypothetical protein